MSTQIAKKETSLIPSDLIVTIGNEEQVKDLTTSANYIPSMRVFDGSSKVVKDGTLSAGEIAVYRGNNDFIKLGKEVNCLVLGYRTRAAVIDGSNVQNFWDAGSEQFKLVEEKAKGGTRGYSAGLEYLVYLPDTKAFAALFMGNKSGRRESPKVLALVGKAATIRSKFVKEVKNPFHCAEVVPCSTPFELPPVEELRKAVEIFSNLDGKSTPEEGREV